jgi:hypothetical protein
MTIACYLTIPLDCCLFGKLLLSLASTVILGSELRELSDNILLSHESGLLLVLAV